LIINLFIINDTNKFITEQFTHLIISIW